MLHQRSAGLRAAEDGEQPGPPGRDGSGSATTPHTLPSSSCGSGGPTTARVFAVALVLLVGAVAARVGVHHLLAYLTGRG